MPRCDHLPHLLAALTLTGCLPLDDLSRYSRGSDTGAGLDAGPQQLTTSPPGLAPGAGDDPASPGGPRADDPAPDADGSASPPPAGLADPGVEPTLPELSLDAGALPRNLPEGCIARLDPDAGAGSCYAISRQPLPWSEALAACLGWGGSLVSINSAVESDWLAATVDVTIWIGANDRLREGSFSWANGDPFVFELFAAGEPDNTFGIQDCVERRVDSSWNDRACNVASPFVCERPL